MRVCIDPGHGLSNRAWGVFDPGAVAAGVFEAHIVMDVALLLQGECRRRGWATILTRCDNAEHSGLTWRVGRARSAGADCIVSLHCNAAESPQAHGVETLYRDHEWVAEAVQSRLAAALELRDRGTKRRTDLAILRYERPAILVELGFISNPTERGLLLNPTFQQKAVRAIADGLEETVRP
ncbi:MAG TPA: N-acetylmuramoyl-L-alanine amidase [Burkholderiaceae bacterium]|nr:N-acetylmuramoyl-L-alanine amidase [Burkholderiaceae bacterium]